MPKAKKKPQKPAKRKKESCEGKECYFSLNHTETIEYTYARLKKKKTCSKPTARQRAKAVLQAQRIFESFAEVYCKAGGYGDDQCDEPCKCKPSISQWASKFKGWKKSGNKCIIEIEISGHIDCTCQD